MRTASIIIALVLALAGLYYLIRLFFIQDDSEIEEKKGSESGIEKVQSAIKEMEEKKPEQVAKIRDQFAAEVQEKSARESKPEDVSGVIKHWMISEENEVEQK